MLQYRHIVSESTRSVIVARLSEGKNRAENRAFENTTARNETRVNAIRINFPSPTNLERTHRGMDIKDGAHDTAVRLNGKRRLLIEYNDNREIVKDHLGK